MLYYQYLSAWLESTPRLLLFVQAVSALLFLLFVDFTTRTVLTLLSLYRSGIPLLNPVDLRLIRAFLDGSPLALFSTLRGKFNANKHGLAGFVSPVGKPFVCVFDEKVLEQIIVHNQDKLVKHHAFGILEYFRKTDLENGVPAWKVVHRIASKFAVQDASLQAALMGLLDRFSLGLQQQQKQQPFDFAVYVKDFYWQVVILLVTGESEEEAEEEEGKKNEQQAKESFSSTKALVALYKEAWLVCIEALGMPISHSFFLTMFLPLPIVLRYRSLASKLRAAILRKIDQGAEQKRPSWCVLSVISNEMSREDQLEVAMEFMFTGASSVTSTLIWAMYHIAQDASLQKVLRNESEEAKEAKDAKEEASREEATREEAPREEAPDERTREAGEAAATNTTSSMPVHQELRRGGSSSSLLVNSNSVPSIMDAVIKETLRLYSPIHIGRLSANPFQITAADGKSTISIPAGTDLFSNMFFVHRNAKLWGKDADTFDASRFVGSQPNVPHFHPFSMGVRSCPGQRIAFAILKIVISKLLIEFDIGVSENAHPPIAESNLMLPMTPTKCFLTLAKRRSNNDAFEEEDTTTKN